MSRRSPPAIAVLLALGAGDLTVAQLVAYKAAFTVMLGALVTPIIALDAMAK